jgi:hypothetical protein
MVGLNGVSGNFFSWGDYNNDGYQDLLINGGRLFRNSGPPTYSFTEVTSEVGLTGGGNGAWADYDNDGNLDLYCTGNDILWHNEGPPGYIFRDVTTEAGNIRDEYPTTAVGWGDYNLDGYVDLYIANGEDWNDGNPIYYPDFMYQNTGNGTFTDITESSGIRDFGGPYYGRGVAWGDFNNDGWPDVYISNYRISQNWLFFNNRNGTFTDVAIEKGVCGEESQRLGNTYYGHTVGSAWADLNNDGDLDLFESNLVHKDLYRGPICGDSQIYRNNGPENGYSFTDVRATSGIPEKNIGGGEDELYVGIAIGDFNNDGFSDLFIPQIYDLEYSYSYLYLNNGDMTFINVSDETEVMVWNTYGGAWGDYNNDGFLDLVTGGKGSAEPNTTYEVHLYRNNGNLNSWLQINLKGRHYNKQGIGARVGVTGNGFTQVREVEGGSGGHSQQNSIPLEFGFGEYSGTVDIEVFWPSGFIQKIDDVSVNQMIEIEETQLAPDLMFISLKTLTTYPIQGDTVPLEASVANMGYLDADTAMVRFYNGKPSAGGIEIGTAQTITDLDRYYSIRVNTDWDTTGEPGVHDIWAVIEDVEPQELVITNNEINITLEIRERNELPLAVLTAKPVKDILVGETVVFNAENSTDDIAVEFYNFDFGDENTTGWIINPITEHQYNQPGTYKTKLKVRDSDGAESTNLQQITLTISSPPMPNQRPIIDSFTSDTTELITEETCTLLVTAHDPDGDELTYHFTAKSGDLNTQEYKSVATWRAPIEEGIYTIRVEVYDGDLFSTQESLDIKVSKELENHPPVITEILVDPLKVNPKNTTKIIVQAYDPDIGDVLTYSYFVGAGEIIGTGSEVTWVAPERPGRYAMLVTVTDSGGLYAESELDITVNTIIFPPEILTAWATPEQVNNDKSVEILLSVELDPTKLDDVYRVTIDLSTIEGDINQKLYDNGKFGDEESFDGIYSYEYMVPAGTAPGMKTLEVTVRDYSQNAYNIEIEFEVLAENKKDKSSTTITPGFESSFIILSVVSLIFLYSARKRRRT